MDELRQLTAGQKAVVDVYLANFEPAETYNNNEHVLIDTQEMIIDMNGMCNFDYNLLCDYLAEKGYHPHFIADDALSGWIMKKVN